MPSKQTLGGFFQAFSSSICSVDYKSFSDEHAAPSRSHHVRLGTIDLIDYQGPSFRSATHRVRHIASNPVDDFLLFLPLNVPFELAQFGNTVLVPPGNFALSTTLQPFETSNRIDLRRNHMKQRVVRIPGAAMRQHMPQFDRLCALRIDGNAGAGAMCKALIDAALGHGQQLSALQGEQYGSMLVNAIGIAALDSLVAQRAIEGATEGGGDAASVRIRLQALAFIESRLADQQLDPRLIADHCGVSLRRLHSAFERTPLAVTACIREMRLQRCRAELQDAALRRQPIFRIAMRWGHTNPENFTRAYRARFGLSPSDERRAATSLTPASAEQPH